MGDDLNTEHEEIADLLPAYALWAVTDDERARVEAHLLTCDRCRREVVGLRGLAYHLPLAVDEREPPARLRQHLLTAAQAEDDHRPVAVERRELPTPLPVRRRFQPSVLAASVLVLLSLGLGAWNVSLQGRLAEQQQQIATLQARPAVTLFPVVATAAAPGVSGEVVYLPQQQTAFLSVDNLPALPAGQAYQMWYIQDGRPVSAGLLPTGPNQAAARLPVDLGRTQAIAVSREPAAGSVAPTGPVVLQAPLTTGNA